MSTSDANTPPHTPETEPLLRNVRAIADLEDKSIRERSRAERIGDVVAVVIGSFAFLGAHILGIVLWVLLNTGFLLSEPFDPFPFTMLTFFLSSESVILALFILIIQNRMTRMADRRAHLSLQISILAEQELTVMLNMQRSLISHLGVPTEVPDDRAAQLVSDVDVGDLADKLDRGLPK
jgi:uncharacterized membrane protein